MLFQGGKIFSKSKIFLAGCLIYIFGSGLASFLPVKLLEFKIWWFSAVVFFLVLTILFWGCKEENRIFPARLVFLLVLVLLFSIWRYSISLPGFGPDKIWHYNQPANEAGNQKVIVIGMVADEPDLRETSQKLEITVKELCFNNEPRPGRCLKVNGRLLLTVDLYPEYEYGDKLVADCELEPPEEFNGFAYDRYLARYDIYSVCYFPEIISFKNFPHSPSYNLGIRGLLYKKIFSFKKIMAGLIDFGMSEPESSLARPIVFGGQRGLEQKIRDDFQKVGLTHIMAVSGFNISIVAAIVMAVLLALGLSRGQAFYLASLFLAGYIVLVGAPASAMRAGLMGFLVLWALKLGRLNKITNSLALAAVLLLVINPKLLRDDVGFQLSFLAMAGLAYVYPIFEACWRKIKLPELRGLSDAFLITLSAQIFTLPVLAFNFSRISLIAPLANLAVLWVLPILTILILAALPLSFMFPAWSFLFFAPSFLLSKYILSVVKVFASLSFSSLEIGYLSPVWVILYYFTAMFIIIRLRRSKLLSW